MQLSKIFVSYFEFKFEHSNVVQFINDVEEFLYPVHQ